MGETQSPFWVIKDISSSPIILSDLYHKPSTCSLSEMLIVINDNFVKLLYYPSNDMNLFLLR